MKKIFPLLLVLLFFVNNLTIAQWHRVKSEACNISVSYPGEVKEQYRSNESIENVSIKEFRYLATSPNHNFLTYCSVWPKGFIEGDIEESLKYGFAGIDGEILSSQRISFDGYPGQSFLVDLASGQGNSFVRAYIINNVVVQMQSIQSNEEENNLSSEGERYFESLRKED